MSSTAANRKLSPTPVMPEACPVADTRDVSASADKWYYPSVLANDLQCVDLPQKVKNEVFTTAFEYARTVIPTYTNWNRYVAFMRIIVIGTIAEFRGSLVDVLAGDDILGYNLQEVLDGIFAGTRGHAEMCREYRSFLLITADKTSDRREGELFRRYVNALAQTPRQWFRLRDADALARFTIAAALACNDLDDVWFTEQQFEILCEIGDTMYDAVAFFKHRSEGETNNTFQYTHPELRVPAVRRCREVLWALDCAWSNRPKLSVVSNFVRLFGGPLFITMRRYRYIEDGCTIGKEETVEIINQVRQNKKLWNRIDAFTAANSLTARYHQALEASDKVMFEGMAEMLKVDQTRHCGKCQSRNSIGSNELHHFGGVKLCNTCKDDWRHWIESLPQRAIMAFSEINNSAVVGKV